MKYSEKDHEKTQENMRYMYQLLNERVIPYSLKRDYNDEFKEFTSFEAFECMEDEVRAVAKTIEVYDTLIDNPLVFMSKSELKRLLINFYEYTKTHKSNGDEIDPIEQMIKDYIRKLGEEEI